MNLPPPEPDDVSSLVAHEPHLVSEDYFRQCCYSFGHWHVAMGTPVEQLQHPDEFFKFDDLARFVDVVSTWPLGTPNEHRAPSLYSMLMDLRTYAGAQRFTFAQRTDWYIERITTWMLNNKIDPANPRESKEDRRKRKNREAVARHRQKHTGDSGGIDPEYDVLAIALRTEAASLSAGKQWLRDEEVAAKLARDREMMEVKERCAKRIATAHMHVAEQQKRVTNAQIAFDQYRSGK